MGSVRMAISRCLLGEACRFDARHRRWAPAFSPAAAGISWVPVCPEVELGLGAPREPLELVELPGGATGLVTVSGRLDLTARFAVWARQRVEELAGQGLAACVLKARSPSCGLAGVARRSRAGWLVASGQGLFAAALAAGLPDLPLVEAEALTPADLAGLAAGSPAPVTRRRAP